MNSLTKLEASVWWRDMELMTVSAILVAFLAISGTALWSFTWRPDSRVQPVELRAPAFPAPPICRCEMEICRAV